MNSNKSAYQTPSIRDAVIDSLSVTKIMKIRTLLKFMVSLLVTSYGFSQTTIKISRVFAESKSNTSQMVLKQRDSTETLHVDRNIAISNFDIAEAVLIEKDSTSIRLTLTEEGKIKFANLTKESINKRLAVVINDRLVSAPKVMAEISGGSFEITGARTEKFKEFAEEIVDTIGRKQKV